MIFFFITIATLNPGIRHSKGFEITNNSKVILKSIKHQDNIFPVENMHVFGGWNEMKEGSHLFLNIFFIIQLHISEGVCHNLVKELQ